jgi:hypothetical protein
MAHLPYDIDQSSEFKRKNHEKWYVREKKMKINERKFSIRLRLTEVFENYVQEAIRW